MRNLRVVLISGLSGSGKTTAIKALEDLGFYCVDNLPIVLFPKFIELCSQSAGRITKAALVVDIRGKEFLEGSRQIIQQLREEGYLIEILFFESSDEILVRRYSETRRQHPLAIGKPVLEGIQSEREGLRIIRDMADKVIDTSEFNVHELQDAIRKYFSKESRQRKMTITLLSFGYSYGIPHEADLLMDVRFLPNPYFLDELKRLTGEDLQVAEYVLKWNETQEFLSRFWKLVEFLIPLYKKEGKIYLTIAIGCTGGRHRSIVVANAMEAYLRKNFNRGDVILRTTHRDIGKG
ncbi:MAG: RNase adapter RapZ [Syntrophobacterales bacterium]|nr:MAG: RNase adapter RapZ [Syntrophobacterales bacterium]